MLDEIDALAALAQLGTVSEAAVRLRVTQSAVSKRLKSLQDRVGFRLLEPDGRRLRLTARGQELVERARPLVAELRALTRKEHGPTLSALSLALADSIASSWGPLALRAALAALPGLSLDLHAHRSVLVVESVQLGRYHAGLCTAPPATRDLVEHEVVAEPMVLVRSGLGPADRPRSGARRPGGADRQLITIEPTSATFRAIRPALLAHHPELLARSMVPVESFGAALQMVRAGFGDGLLPLGLVEEQGVPAKAIRPLSSVSRRVVLVTRKTIADLPIFRSLHERLAIEARALLSGHGAPGRPRTKPGKKAP